jgi:hypothetical protein
VKPWRQYWKELEWVRQELSREVIDSPFKHDNEICDWILNLRYVDLRACDSTCKSVIGQIIRQHRNDKIFLAIEGVRWQLIVRCEFALDFCRGRVLKRSEFDWSKNSEAIYKFLLIELWYQDAVYWANRRFGQSETNKLRREVFSKHPHSNLSNN